MMMTLVKFNKIVSWATITIFLIELLLLLSADFSKNRGTTEGIAILFFVLTYVWFTIPAVISIILGNRLKEKRGLLVILFIINIGILITSIPMFISYL